MSELGPANDDLRNCESAGSRDRIRLATGPQADESYATIWIVRRSDDLARRDPGSSI